MLINLSNHPLSTWLESQIEAGNQHYGSIIDMPFPNIDPNASLQEVKKTAKEYAAQIEDILKASRDKRDAVHLMGEFTFTYQLVNSLKKREIDVVASTTEREVINMPEGTKVVKFKFRQFRSYY